MRTERDYSDVARLYGERVAVTSFLSQQKISKFSIRVLGKQCFGQYRSQKMRDQKIKRVSLQIHSYSKPFA